MWAFLKFTNQLACHKPIADSFKAVKTPLSNNIPPPMGQDVCVYVDVPWQIHKTSEWFARNPYKSSTKAQAGAFFRFDFSLTVLAYTVLLLLA